MATTAALSTHRVSTVPARRIGVGVLGATGYAGAELVRLLLGHPFAHLQAVGAHHDTDKLLQEACPWLSDMDLALESNEVAPQALRTRGVDVVFAALPHGVFAARAASYLDAGLRVIDLSADFRVRDAATYPQRYGFTHPAPHLLQEAVYGLSEWCHERVAEAQIVANPGCYATAVLLAILPVTAAGLHEGAPIVVNAMSGISGAGRAAKLGTHFVECGGTVSPYKVGTAHPHMGEMLQALGVHARGSAAMVFNPHLVPMTRGILVTAAVPLRQPLSAAGAQDLYLQRYGTSPFVRVLPAGVLPETRHVRGSNRCDLAVQVAADGRMLLVFAAIDNLVKGAAGQAIQNWNRMQGWPEDTGLPRIAWASA